MEPIVTLPYSEWLVAEQLMKALPSNQGYSVYAPLSRQEKGVDLLLTRRSNGVSRSATIQVKYSRAYQKGPKAAFRFVTWYRSFPVPDEADFFILVSLYPDLGGPDQGKKGSCWLPLMLVFRRDEMAEFMSSLRTRSGKVDKMFYFGFDSPDRVFQTRGAPELRDFSTHTFANRLSEIEKFVSAA